MENKNKDVVDLLAPEFSRAKRRNRTDNDLGILSKGGIFDLFDNSMKQLFRINDDEYDYIAGNLTDEESDILFDKTNSFTNIKQCLVIVENHLKTMYKPT